MTAVHYLGCNPVGAQNRFSCRCRHAFAGNANERSKPSSFGGGFDLTPYYPFREDVISWHQHAYDACSNFGDDMYPRYKKWCDEYFFLKHRNETRGVGGLFYDDLNELGFERSFAFTRALGDEFSEAW